MLLENAEPRVSEQVIGPLHEALVGKSAFIQEVRELINRLAPTELTVLVTGETGTGKDIVARLLHRKSSRKLKPFIKVNAPAVPGNLFESELFGHEKGAFTGASQPKPGRFELAHKGTIFLDEIAEISHEAQSKLVQVLDGEPFMRVGGVTPIEVEVRVIAATNVEIDGAVKNGRLRRDVAFRLSECVIHMLPLRERSEDIPLLAEHFNYNYSKQYDRQYQAFPTEVIREMTEMPWRGNVRELAARCKEFVVSGTADVMTEEDPRAPETPETPEPAQTGKATAKKTLMPLKVATRMAVEQTERALIEEALEQTLWNRKKAAQLLDISYSSLLRRISIYNIGKS